MEVVAGSIELFFVQSAQNVRPRLSPVESKEWRGKITLGFHFSAFYNFKGGVGKFEKLA